MRPQKNTDGTDGVTVYDRDGSIEDDPLADEHYNDELDQRINLRVPEWLYEEIGRHADYTDQSRAEYTRALVLKALQETTRLDQVTEPRLTYGDCKCPSCFEEQPYKLTWGKTPEGVRVHCKNCGYTGDLDLFREMETLDRELAEIWGKWALAIPDADETHAQPTVRRRFEEFLEDPRAFVESVDWNDELTEAGEQLEDYGVEAQTQEEEVYEHLEEWEAEHE